MDKSEHEICRICRPHPDLKLNQCLQGRTMQAKRLSASCSGANGMVPWVDGAFTGSPIRYAYAAYGSSPVVGPLRPIVQCSHVKAVRIEIVADRGWPLLCLKDQADDLDAPPVFRGMAHPVHHCHLSHSHLESQVSDVNGYAIPISASSKCLAG